MSTQIKHKYNNSTVLFIVCSSVFLGSLFWFGSPLLAIILFTLSAYFSTLFVKLHCTVSDEGIVLRKSIFKAKGLKISFQQIRLVEFVHPYIPTKNTPWIYITLSVEIHDRMKKYQLPFTGINDIAKLLYLLEVNNVEYTIRSGKETFFDHELERQLEWEKNKYKESLSQ